MSDTRRVRLLFADGGAFHHEVIRVPGNALDAYPRLIDALLEDEGILKKAYVDRDRLCAARLMDADEE